MSRPPKYTDDDIAEAIDSLIGEGKEVNPSRVKHLLGGGNIQRIKAVIDRRGRDLSSAGAGMPDLPPSMMAELGRHNDRGADDLRRLAARLWQSAREEASKGLETECAALRSRVLALEEELSEASRQLQRAAPERVGEGETFTNENRRLVEQSERLKERCGMRKAIYARRGRPSPFSKERSARTGKRSARCTTGWKSLSQNSPLSKAKG